MGPSSISFLSFRVICHFHDYGTFKDFLLFLSALHFRGSLFWFSLEIWSSTKVGCHRRLKLMLEKIKPNQRWLKHCKMVSMCCYSLLWDEGYVKVPGSRSWFWEVSFHFMNDEVTVACFWEQVGSTEFDQVISAGLAETGWRRENLGGCLF